MKNSELLDYWITWVLGMVAGMFLVLPKFEGNGAFLGLLVWLSFLMLIGYWWAGIMSGGRGR